MKKYIWIPFLVVCTLFAAALACHASTYSATVADSYHNELALMYQRELLPPFQKDNADSQVELTTLDVNIEETDLHLPGKNGLDVTVNRRFSSGRPQERFTLLQSSDVPEYADLPAYQYENDELGTVWIVFPCEKEMLDNANETMMISQYSIKENSEIFYKWEQGIYPRSALSFFANCVHNALRVQKGQRAMQMGLL